MADNRRLQTRILRLTVILLFGLLAGDLFYMQIIRHDHYRGLSLKNRQVSVRVRAPRGRILDRDGRILADNIYIADITLPRSALTDAGCDSTLERLIEWFDLPREELIAGLTRQRERGRSRLTVVPNASMPRIAAVEERGRELPGAMVESRARRRYLYGSLFAHIIGYVGEATEQEIDAAGEGASGPIYRPGDTVGREGIEAYGEEMLRGLAGTVLHEANAAGRNVGRNSFELVPVVPGLDIRLTLSLDLQDSLSTAMDGRRGCAIAMDLRRGDVLAAVSNPAYDPNLLTTGISAADWNELLADPGHPFLNRLVQASYPPGSPYKVVTSLAGLQYEAVGTHTMLEPCTGSYRFGNRSFRCWKHSGHGSLDHIGALVHSCDVFYYQLGLRLELDQIHDTAIALGLGNKVGAPFAGESAGNIPTREWYDKRFGPRGWTRGVMLNNAIGQGEILVTPLQMTVLTGRVASSGATPAPRFIIDGVEPEPTYAPGTFPIDEKNLEWVRHSMEQVVDIGTGTAARLHEIEVAGKTGTAENPHGADHAWFICFAPVHDPEVAMAIILEHAGHGGAVAAPVAARWLAAYFASDLEGTN